MSEVIEKAKATNQRPPDCVTEVRMGNTVLTVSGFFKQDGVETAMDKMVKAIKADAAVMPGAE